MAVHSTVRGPSEGDLEALVEQWTHDTSAARDRTLELIRTGHMVMGPAVVLGLLLFSPGSALTIAGLIYLSGLIAVLGLVPRHRQAGSVALFDILLVGHVCSTDPQIWMALLAPSLAAVTIGWLVSARTTWALWATCVGSMGAAGYVAEPSGWLMIWLVFAGTSAAMNFNNLEILGEGRAGVLRVADLVDSLPVIVWEGVANTGRLTRAVGWINDLVGYAPDEWRELSVARRVHRDDVQEYLDLMESAALSDDPLLHEFRLRCADGTSIRVREVVRRVIIADTIVLRGVILDITDEAAAREAVDRLAAVVAHQLEPLTILAPRESVTEDPTVLQINSAFAALAGVDADEVVSHRLVDVAPWLPRVLRADLDDFITSGRLIDRDDIEITTPRGTRTYDYGVVGLPDGAVAVQFADVTDRKAATELIRHQAFHDPLTSLPNRSLLFDRLSHALSTMARTQGQVGLLLLDLNQFKEINDTLGHAYGDELLVEVADRLYQMTRESDTVARLGGDEFAMVVIGAAERELADVAARVYETVNQAVDLGGIPVEVTCSIGGAVAPGHGSDAHTLLQRADVAMYDSKRSGVPFRLYARDDDRHSLDRLTLMGELRNLIDRELDVWYQPKVDLRTGVAHEVEALARWDHPRMGLLNPSQFIELCEVSGLVAELTFAVLDKALGVIADWPDMRVAVNVPVRNLYDRSLPNIVNEALQKHGVAADRLILEITEREIMEDHRSIFEVLEDLDRRGVKISIDDFGTGFSSLTHLRRLPISEIKIDQSFISGMLDRENDYIIARSIIDLAHNLGHRVVAEGVEDTSTLELLRGLGCDVAQGFLFARPGPAARVRQQVLSGPALTRDGELGWVQSV